MRSLIGWLVLFKNFCMQGYSVEWGKREGFAHVAIDAKVPIIPVFTENIREVGFMMEPCLNSLCWYFLTILQLGLKCICIIYISSLWYLFFMNYLLCHYHFLRFLSSCLLYYMKPWHLCANGISLTLHFLFLSFYPLINL